MYALIEILTVCTSLSVNVVHLQGRSEDGNTFL